MTVWFSINGHLMPTEAQDNALINDRGLAYGHGLFETILFRNGQLPLLNHHLQRICSDAEALGITICSQTLTQYIEQFCAALSENAIDDGAIKVIATAGQGGRGYKSPLSPEPNLICSYSALPDDLHAQRQQGISVRCCDYRLPTNVTLAGIKHLNRLDQVIARSEWNSSDYAEGLMFSSEDKLIEAISANIFLKDATGQWLTPDLKASGINGVMRSLLLGELFPKIGVSVKVTDIDRQQLLNCQALLICNSIRGIIPVTDIYNEGGVLQKTLPRDRQMRMLMTELVNNYPHYQ